jgi:hypothetical protein
MGFVTITTWEVDEGVALEVSLRAIAEKRLPALKGLGAERVTLIRTSHRTLAAITVWPDRATRDRAIALVQEVRRKVTAEDASRMTGEMLGEVMAEV